MVVMLFSPLWVYFWLQVLQLAFFFFFSSRRRHTRSDRDWSSDVCSSDLRRAGRPARTDAAPPPLQARGGVPAPDHLRSAPHPGRPDAPHLGALSALGERADRKSVV